MARKFPKRGKLLGLRALVGAIPARELTLRLFASDTVPARDDDGSEYVEASFAGYRPVLLSARLWDFGEEDAAYPEQTWKGERDQPPQQVYGFYLTRGADFVHAERFDDGPYEIKSHSDEITVSVVLQ